MKDSGCSGDTSKKEIKLDKKRKLARKVNDLQNRRQTMRAPRNDVEWLMEEKSIKELEELYELLK